MAGEHWVNAQLISYYFDGEAGLYRALQSRWHGVTTSITRPDRPLAEIAGEFVRASGQHRAWGRLLAWKRWVTAPGRVKSQASTPELKITPTSSPSRSPTCGVARKQASLPADVDPAHLLLALFAMTSAPTVLPSIVRRILGADPDAEEFRKAYADQIGRLIRHFSSGN